MPRTPRRRAPRRRLPPRPTYSGAPRIAEEAAPTPTRRDDRPRRHIARESPLIVAELRRVLAVTVVTFGLLVVLTVMDRLS